MNCSSRSTVRSSCLAPAFHADNGAISTQPLCVVAEVPRNSDDARECLARGNCNALIRLGEVLEIIPLSSAVFVLLCVPVFTNIYFFVKSVPELFDYPVYCLYIAHFPGQIYIASAPIHTGFRYPGRRDRDCRDLVYDLSRMARGRRGKHGRIARADAYPRRVNILRREHRVFRGTTDRDYHLPCHAQPARCGPGDTQGARWSR
ncbi:hypothetical protein BC628DRAFT_919409 [Trametes gibbosa]|nr:hypothetical protein BC628DRAFT_919409 [Trametes gibbosa]